MKKLAMFIFALSLGLSVFASGKGWMTNLEDAMKLSEQSGKPILLEFAGSNWCVPCIILKKNVFSKKVFVDFAKKNLILVLIDFPDPSNLTEKQKVYNQKLYIKYKAQGFPTVLLLDSKGKILSRTTGYGEEDAPRYIEFLKSKMSAKKVVKTAKAVKAKK